MENYTEFETIIDDGGFMPEKAHDPDAGFDLRCKEEKIIYPKQSAVFDTGVHINIPYGYVGFLKAKSGLNIKLSIVGEGVIDSGYQGAIVVKLYNHGDKSYIFHKGDKIIQIVFLKIPEIKLNKVEAFSNTTERGNNGFGSSGK